MRSSMLVMQNKTHREFIKEVLISNEYQIVFETDNKSLGIQKCEELMPDIIILDLDDFIQGEKYNPVTIRAIRQFNKEVAIIMAEPMTPDGKWLSESIRAGADYAIIFPVTSTDVLRALEKALICHK